MSLTECDITLDQGVSPSSVLTDDHILVVSREDKPSRGSWLSEKMAENKAMESDSEPTEEEVIPVHLI